MDLVNHLPWGLAALLIGATFVVAWRYPRTKKVMSALRAPLLQRLRRPPKLTVAPPPPVADENGPQPPGQPVPTDPENPGGGPTGGMG